jgi:hypothetical protein
MGIPKESILLNVFISNLSRLVPVRQVRRSENLMKNLKKFPFENARKLTASEIKAAKKAIEVKTGKKEADKDVQQNLFWKNLFPFLFAYIHKLSFGPRR